MLHRSSTFSLISVVEQKLTGDDYGCKLSVLVAAKAGRMSHHLASVQKTDPLHCLCRSIFGQHASHYSRSVFTCTVLQQYLSII